jgi:hypothetical protein
MTFAGIFSDINNIVIGFLNHRQARSSLYANTQLRAHRRAEEKKIKSKTNKINKEYNFFFLKSRKQSLVVAFCENSMS